MYGEGNSKSSPTASASSAVRTIITSLPRRHLRLAEPDPPLRLRNGNTVADDPPPKRNKRYFALLRRRSINGDDPNLLSRKIFFDD